MTSTTAFVLLALSCATLAAVQTAKLPVLEIRVDQPGHPINRTQYGVFFEELQHSGEGGLYAELINNRSFEDSPDLAEWHLYSVGDARGAMTMVPYPLLNSAQTRTLQVDITSPGTVGVANGGYWGINMVKGRVYSLSFFAKSELPADATITAKLQSKDGSKTYGSCTINRLSTEWKKFTGKLNSKGNDPQGRFSLEITTSQPGKLYLDVVSLFPPTWKGRPNGVRPDLAEMVARMKPAIIRFPGGSYVSCWPSKSPNWMKQLGPIEDRPGHPAIGEKNPWNYRNNDGFGFHEYLQFAEDLGAEPIYVFQGGSDPVADLNNPQTYLTGAALDALIQDILDGIKYANGPTSTRWGAKRAANGHPKPFNMKYIQIGNENWKKPFQDNYIKIYNAVKAKYPDMQIIWGGDWCGTNEHGYKSDGVMPTGSAAQIVDEHYYQGGDYFYGNSERFSPKNYPRGVDREAKVFLGEVSAVKDNLEAALKETAFLLGAEKYSDKVVMAVYAPLFNNVNFKEWPANAINFDSSRAYGTPSYHAQAMLGCNVGDANIGVAGLDGLLNRSLFVNANLVKSTGEIIVKLVNREKESRVIQIDIRGGAKAPTSAREIVLTAPDLNAENSLDKPQNVAPVEKKLGKLGSSFTYTVQPYSFTVLRLKP